MGVGIGAIGPGIGGSGGGGGGSGTVTSVSVVSTQGFAGTVATATTTPAISISTTVTGITKGNGTTLSAATAGTDYLAPSGAAPSKVTAQSSTYSATAGDIVLATAGAGGFTVTLPASTANRQVTVKKVDNGAGTITIATTSGNIDGAATATITTQYVSFTMVADGTNWNQI
jgi:hypothetical protein